MLHEHQGVEGTFLDISRWLSEHRCRVSAVRVIAGPFLAVVLTLVNGSTLLGQMTAPAIESISTSFVTEENYVFDAKVVAPADPERRNGFGILMIGGGIANDLDWSIPGFITQEGKQQQLTITGESHADAPILAAALAKRGFVVMHYTTIRRDDPKRDRWPNEATLYSLRDLLRFSKAALSKLRTQLGVDDKIILLGHSLGAVRAANIVAEDRNVEALVLLAPAQLTRTSGDDRGQNSNHEPALKFLQAVDRNHDAACSPEEFQTWRRAKDRTNHLLASQPFKSLDFHPDCRLLEWEIAAGFARTKRREIDFCSAKSVDRFGMRWPEDVLRNTKLNTLLLFGDLDNAQSHHAPIMAELIASEQLDHVDLQVLPNLGHQLGREENDRVGPIAEEALGAIGEWLEAHIP